VGEEGGFDVLLHSFLNWVLDGGVCGQRHASAALLPEKKNLVCQLNGKLDVLEKRKICASAGIRTPDLPPANLAILLTTLCWLLCVFELFMLCRCDSCLGRSYRVFNCNFADLFRRVMMLTGSGLSP